MLPHKTDVVTQTIQADYEAFLYYCGDLETMAKFALQSLLTHWSMLRKLETALGEPEDLQDKLEQFASGVNDVEPHHPKKLLKFLSNA